jgi:hypothetical protein
MNRGRHYPPELVKRVIDEHGRLMATKKAVPVQLKALPDEATLSLLIDTCYQASMLSEESRPLTFQLVYGSRKASREGRVLHDLENRPEFTPLALRKLSPATDLADTFLVVEGSATPPDHVRITALGHAPPAWWDKDPYFDLAPPPMPSTLYIRVRGPGSMTIGWGINTLVTLECGRLVRVVSDLLKAKAVGSFFDRVITDLAIAAHGDLFNRTAGRERNDLLDEVRRLYFHCVRSVIGRARSTSHGALFLVVPDDSIILDKARGHLNIKYPLRGSSPFDIIIAKRRADYQAQLAVQPEYPDDLEVLQASFDERPINAKLARSLSCIGDFGKVDGAVLLTDRLEPVGFGAEICARTDLRHVIQAKAASGQELTEDDLAGQEQSIDQFGTRHRSAFRFCRDVPGIAFVLSQDGGVKVARSLGDSVYLWSSSEPD